MEDATNLLCITDYPEHTPYHLDILPASFGPLGDDLNPLPIQVKVLTMFKLYNDSHMASLGTDPHPLVKDKIVPFFHRRACDTISQRRLRVGSCTVETYYGCYDSGYGYYRVVEEPVMAPVPVGLANESFLRTGEPWKIRTLKKEVSVLMYGGPGRRRRDIVANVILQVTGCDSLVIELFSDHTTNS